jgi:hypothetical protein
MEAQINIGEDAGERGGVPPGEHGRAALEVELCERAWLLDASAASSLEPYALLLLLEVELRRDLEMRASAVESLAVSTGTRRRPSGELVALAAALANRVKAL